MHFTVILMTIGLINSVITIENDANDNFLGYYNEDQNINWFDFLVDVFFVIIRTASKFVVQFFFLYVFLMAFLYFDDIRVKMLIYFAIHVFLFNSYVRFFFNNLFQ